MEKSLVSSTDSQNVSVIINNSQIHHKSDWGNSNPNDEEEILTQSHLLPDIAVT
jgi:hypothetical protein